MLHGHDLAVRAELHIERALRTVKHRIPLDLCQILHRLPTVGTSGIFCILHPVAKAADGIHILTGRTVKQGHRRFAQHKGIFREGLVVLGTDIAIRLLRAVKEFGGKDLHAAIQSEPVEGGAFEESHAAGAAGGSQTLTAGGGRMITEVIQLTHGNGLTETMMERQKAIISTHRDIA